MTKKENKRNQRDQETAKATPEIKQLLHQKQPSLTRTSRTGLTRREKTQTKNRGAHIQIERRVAAERRRRIELEQPRSQVSVHKDVSAKQLFSRNKRQANWNFKRKKERTKKTLGTSKALGEGGIRFLTHVSALSNSTSIRCQSAATSTPGE